MALSNIGLLFGIVEKPVINWYEGSRSVDPFMLDGKYAVMYVAKICCRLAELSSKMNL
jgi:hypothetical protein